MNFNRGMTLIEIAIVFVIIGIAIALGASLVGPLTQRSKIIDTRETVKAAKEALSGYAVKNGFLPATIGLSGGRELDGWGRNIAFYPAPGILGSGRDVCGVTSTKTNVKECISDDCSTFNTKSNIAFLIYSIGEDADGVCTGTGVCSGGSGTCPFPTCTGVCSAGVCTGGTGTCICTGTCNAGVCSGGTGTCPTCTGTCTFPIWQQTSGYNSPCTYTATNPAFRYDDIVQYVTLDEVRSARSCSFAITNQSLPDAINGTAYSTQLQATGGQTPYTSWLVTNGALPTGITLSTPGGLISGTPTAAGVYNFTVTLTDANGVQTSKAFTLNVIGSAGTCFITGINIVNRTGASRYFTRNGGACSPAWANNASLNAQGYGVGGIQQTDTYNFWTNSTCTTACASTPSLNFTQAQTVDANQNCQIQFNTANCGTADF